jgi:hypothetical protein
LPSGPQPGAAGFSKPQTGRSGNEAEPDGDESEGMKTLRAIADKIRERHPALNLSKSAAISLAMQTPQGAAAYLQDRRARTRVA